MSGYSLKRRRSKLAILATYKYNLYMRPAQRDISYVQKQFTEEKFKEVIKGSIDLLISPLYFDDKINIWFYAPTFDIDFKTTPKASALIFTKRLLYNIRKYADRTLKHTILEWTGTGIHVVMNKAYSITPEEMVELRKQCRRLSPEMDCIASFRQTPIRRIGSTKNNNVVVPVHPEKLLSGKFPGVAVNKHLDYMNEKDWHNYLKTFLIPKTFKQLKEGNAVHMIKNIINA